MRSPVLPIIAAIVIFMIIATGINYFFIDKPFQKKPPSTQTQPATGGQIIKVEESNMVFMQKLEELRRAAEDVCRTGEPRNVSLVFTEEEVNQQAMSMMVQSQSASELAFEVKKAHVSLKPDIMLTEVDVVALNMSFKVTVKSCLGVEDGKPSIDINDVDVPYLLSSFKRTIASFARQKGAELIDQLTAAEGIDNEKLDLQFTDIKTRNQELAVSIVIKPKQYTLGKSEKDIA